MFFSALRMLRILNYWTHDSNLLYFFNIKTMWSWEQKKRMKMCSNWKKDHLHTIHMNTDHCFQMVPFFFCAQPRIYFIFFYTEKKSNVIRSKPRTIFSSMAGNDEHVNYLHSIEHIVREFIWFQIELLHLLLSLPTRSSICIHFFKFFTQVRIFFEHNSIERVAAFAFNFWFIFIDEPTRCWWPASIWLKMNKENEFSSEAFV